MASVSLANTGPVPPGPGLTHFRARLSEASQAYFAAKYEYELRRDSGTTVRDVTKMIDNLPNCPYTARAFETFWRSREEAREEIERRVLGKPRRIRRKQGSYGSRTNRSEPRVSPSSSRVATSTLNKSGFQPIKRTQAFKTKQSRRGRKIDSPSSWDSNSNPDPDSEAVINLTDDGAQHSPVSYIERNGVIHIDDSDDDMDVIQPPDPTPPQLSPNNPASSPNPRITDEQARFAAALMFSLEKFATKEPDEDLRAEWYKLIWQEMSEEYRDFGLDAAGWTAAFTHFKEQFDWELQHMRHVGLEVTFGLLPDLSDDHV